MLAWTIVGAVSGALVVAAMFLGWLVRYASSNEHRVTALEAKMESLRAAILGLVEESKLDAKGAQDFTTYVRGELSEHKYEIAALKGRARR